MRFTNDDLLGNTRGKGGDVLRRREFRLARVALLTCSFMLVSAIGAYRNDVVQAQRLETLEVSVESDGSTRSLRTSQTTVGAVLKEAGIEVGPLDMVTPALGERLSKETQISIVRVHEAMETSKEPIAYETVRTFSRLLRPGQTKVTKTGVRGMKEVRRLVRYEDGVVVKRIVVGAKVLQKPEKQVVAVGSLGRYASRGEFSVARSMRMSASAYDPGPRSCGRYATGRTSCGLRAGYGVVAVDPRVIRLGTRLYVEGYGHAIAGDTGRAIKGNRIDLGFDSYREAMRFGRRPVTVHVLRR